MSACPLTIITHTMIKFSLYIIATICSYCYMYMHLQPPGLAFSYRVSIDSEGSALSVPFISNAS